jgi:hypothetical protein
MKKEACQNSEQNTTANSATVCKKAHLSPIENFAKNDDLQKNLPESLPDNVDVATLIRFMQHMKIPELFATLSDSRQQSKVTYKLSSLALWSLAACIFRQGSKNALHTTLEGLPPEQQEGMLHFLGIEGEDLPHYTTVDDALARVNYEELNEVLLKIFEQMNNRKIFYNHAAVLLPDNAFHIGTDGLHLHTYDHPHSIDDQGNNCCPYCLPRTHFKGTEKEKTQWVHIVVVFAFICEDFKIPLYVYPLKAQQVDTNASDEKLKQECELTAAHAVLPLLRKRFPKLNLVFLGDGLYANKPFIRLCEQLGIGYMIVRKEKSLTTLGRKCDELSKSELYQKSYSHKEVETSKKTEIKRKYAWFNNSDLGDGLKTNVLRFNEEVFGIDGKVSRYKGEWLCSERLSKHNCSRRATRGRMRWKQEDLHNSVKNRGFNIKHDIARANPTLLFIWKLMTFIAFCIFEIFSLLSVARVIRGSRSLMKFAKDMLQELVHISWKRIESSMILKKVRVQFRFHFAGYS